MTALLIFKYNSNPDTSSDIPLAKRVKVVT
jgi:hypothetical protein